MHLPQAHLPWKPRWFIDETVLRREGNARQGRKLTYRALELGSNNFSVILVSSLGFFTGSYILLTSDTILPMLGFVYWHDAVKPTHETAFNNATTAGCMVGMLAFAVLADIYGRRKIYGFEIILLMLGSIGLVMSSTGYVPPYQMGDQSTESIDYGSLGSMNIQSWLLFWRFLSGVGIGGEYPLSAVIASEFAPTAKRPRILSTVFAMQSFGVATGVIVSLVVTKVVQARHPYDSTHPEASSRAVDQIWRWTVGLSLIPALITAIMRFTIPESPRFTLDVQNKPLKAFQETEKLKRFGRESNPAEQVTTVAASEHSGNTDDDDYDNNEYDAGFSSLHAHDTEDSPPTTTIRQYFWVEGNWRYLAATSASWFMLDFALFALAQFSTRALSSFWNGPVVAVKNPKIWNSNTTDPNASMFSILIGNSIHVLVIKGIPAIAGSILLVCFISRLNRKMLTWVTFLVVGVLLIITGVVLLQTTKQQCQGISIALFALCEFFQQFGGGPLTFLIPAELFPTKYRATCHGISAAFGKLGAVLATIFLRYVTFGEGSKKVTSTNSPTVWLSYVLIIFSIPMFIGAGVVWLWLPELQDPSNKNKTLEELAEGRIRVLSSFDDDQTHDDDFEPQALHQEGGNHFTSLQVSL